MNFSTYERNINYRMRELNGKYYLFGENNCFEVNQIARLIYLAIGRDLSLENFVCKVSKKFQYDDIIKIEKDTIEFLNSLISADIVKGKIISV